MQLEKEGGAQMALVVEGEEEREIREM